MKLTSLRLLFYRSFSSSVVAEWSSLGWKLCWRELSQCRINFSMKEIFKSSSDKWSQESLLVCSHTSKHLSFSSYACAPGLFLLNFNFLILGCHFLFSFIQNEIIQIENIQLGYNKIGKLQIEYIQFWFNKQVVHIISFSPFLEWPVVFTCFKCSWITLLGPTSLPSYSIELFPSTNNPWEQHNK